MNHTRRRRTVAGIFLLLVALALVIFNPDNYLAQPPVTPPSSPSDESAGPVYKTAEEALGSLAVKGRAAKTGYSRQQFGNGWGIYQGCDMRNNILARDMTEVVRDESCRVISGVLSDPYSGETMNFLRGPDTSPLIQIDHVVALSDAWQKGAQQLTRQQRIDLANDPLELLAVNGKLNEEKSNSDAASWLPPNKPFRCQYVARQIAVKQKYSLWVTSAEADVMRRVLKVCPGQLLPEPQLKPSPTLVDNASPNQ